MLSKYQKKKLDEAFYKHVSTIRHRDLLAVEVETPTGATLQLPVTANLGHLILLNDTYYLWVRFKDPVTKHRRIGGWFVPYERVVQLRALKTKLVREAYDSEWLLPQLSTFALTKPQFDELFETN